MRGPVAYYNEIDPYAAQWLRNLIDAGHIAPGVVDERSIEDVTPDELREYTQCHFFAGVGVWSYALRNAGVSDDTPVWTGSCPCQPFSAAGKGTGFDDERHLWPAFHHLISECAPSIVFGEQVASAHANAWIDLVQTDLEAVGYGVGSVPFPAAGIGAPHIRDRLYWVAHADDAGLERWPGMLKRSYQLAVRAGGVAGRLADSANIGFDGRGAGIPSDGTDSPRFELERLRDVVGLADADHIGPQRGGNAGSGEAMENALTESPGGMPDNRPGPTNGYWRNADWIGCRDNKFRPVEPGSFPLVNGATSRVGRLRAYGNAINAEAARIFIECAFAALSEANTL